MPGNLPKQRELAGKGFPIDGPPNCREHYSVAPTPSTVSGSVWGLKHDVSPFIVAYPDGLVNPRHKDLAVANLSRLRSLDDRFHGLIEQFVRYHQFQLHL